MTTFLTILRSIRAGKTDVGEIWLFSEEDLQGQRAVVKSPVLPRMDDGWFKNHLGSDKVKSVFAKSGSWEMYNDFEFTKKRE